MQFSVHRIWIERAFLCPFCSVVNLGHVRFQKERTQCPRKLSWNGRPTFCNTSGRLPREESPVPKMAPWDVHTKTGRPNLCCHRSLSIFIISVCLSVCLSVFLPLSLSLSLDLTLSKMTGSNFHFWWTSFAPHTSLFVRLFVCLFCFDGGGFFLGCEDFGRMFDNSSNLRFVCVCVCVFF